MKFKQDIKAGTTILKEEPFVYVLSSKFRTENCDNCLKSGELLKCSSCQYVYYCDKVCQKEAWSLHKIECPLLKKVSPRIIPDAARLLSRIIIRLKKGGDQIKSYYSENQFRMFKDLMSHYSDLKDDQKRMNHFTSLYGVLYEYIGINLMPNSAELMGIYGRMCVNSFSICDHELKTLGTGIYLGASIVDHSCDPTAIAIFEGTTIRIRTVKDITNFDWSKILISYIDVLNTPKMRQDELLQIYYFLCQCSKCLDVKCLDIMLSAMCPNLNCGSAIPMHNNSAITLLNCTKCGFKLTEDFITNYKEVIEFTEMQLQNMKQLTYLDVCKVCLKKQNGILHKLNIYHVKILDMAFESSIDFGQFDDAREYGIELNEGYLTYYGKYHPLVALLYLKLGKILLYQNNIEMAKNYLKQASDILKITHEPNSTLFRKEFIPLLHQVQQ